MKYKFQLTVRDCIQLILAQQKDAKHNILLKGTLTELVRKNPSKITDLHKTYTLSNEMIVENITLNLLERKCQVVNFAKFHLNCFQSIRKSIHMTTNRF